MEYRQLGKSNVSVSAVTFGAWAIGGWMWGGSEHKDAIKAIQTSIDEGVTSIDTAPIYGQGYSEELVGEALQGVNRDKVQVLTKFGMRWDLASPHGELAMKSKDNQGNAIDVYKYAGRDSVIKECEDSLRRLRTDYIDLYQIHWHDSTTPIEETYEAVLRLQEQGKILEAGVCNYNVSQMKRAHAVIPLASNQVPYSMVEKGIEHEVVPYAIRENIGILAYSPLQRGILTGKIRPGHVFAEGDNRGSTRSYQPENVRRINDFLAKIKPLAESKNATLGQLVIRWTIERPGISAALVGARNADQALQNARAVQVRLSSEEIDFINKHLQALLLVS
ncbi:Predicted oxidoreductase [Chitinophaga costaii]|uniref:Predicted oxidoreductase n=1 Tax=Chitinophaga costaii TaxID=1335309 RepID=A0A1C4CDY3_9BACT|nr:aldo/keto reductase [Chitinophaga costaii]PUZ27130.1 aldo/keto reductase [Chitinophaga costaii]SCC17228.1 Predicted oxidoreductase [Chitinophaga costaii]